MHLAIQRSSKKSGPYALLTDCLFLKNFIKDNSKAVSTGIKNTPPCGCSGNGRYTAGFVCLKTIGILTIPFAKWYWQDRTRALKLSAN